MIETIEVLVPSLVGALIGVCLSEKFWNWLAPILKRAAFDALFGTKGKRP